MCHDCLAVYLAKYDLKAETLFTSRGIRYDLGITRHDFLCSPGYYLRCAATYLPGSERFEAHDILFEYLERYFEKGRLSGRPDRIVRTHRPPIYFQHAGTYISFLYGQGDA